MTISWRASGMSRGLRSGSPLEAVCQRGLHSICGRVGRSRRSYGPSSECIRMVFRQHRYRAYCGYRSSEDRFFDRVKKTFGDVAIVLYGDWGRNPNIRNQPPSPGVGLRRRMAQRFRVYLTRESYTSSHCPACESGGLIHPRQRRVLNKRTGVTMLRPVHHLLRCPNNGCKCRTWQRDVLGALNILKNGTSALTTGAWMPQFSHVLE